jgi:uncharacterized protein YbaP (TraB family)
MCLRVLRFCLTFVLALPLAAVTAAEREFCVPVGAGIDTCRGLLWRIEPPDGRRPSHLFGTIHLDDPRVTSLPAPVRAAFDAADSLTSEMFAFIAVGAGHLPGPGGVLALLHARGYRLTPVY